MFSMKSVFLLISMAFLFSGCTEATVTDSLTQPTIATVKAESGNVVILLREDGMLGHADYTKEELVIDTDYYNNHSLLRGEVVYISHPNSQPEKDLNNKHEETGILRVVGLEGETVRINTGLVYIDGRRLDTFYGKPPGPVLKELKAEESTAAGNEKENLGYRVRNYETDNMESVKVPKGSVFLLGDNRGRAVDSELFGPVSTQNIRGKVIGFLEKHAWTASPIFTISFPHNQEGKDSLQLRGEKGKVAIVDQPIIAGKAYQNYWFFWGKPEELSGTAEIVAVRRDNPMNRRVIFGAGGVSGPIAGADGHILPSNMTITEPGLWRLEAYISGKYFGSLVVEVKANTEPTPFPANFFPISDGS